MCVGGGGGGGLTLSTEKTEGIVVGEGLNESDVRPVQVEGGSMDVVQDLTYLGANISRVGRSLVR